MLDKYLKSHKNEDLDIPHFEKVIKILNETLALQDEITNLDIFYER